MKQIEGEAPVFQKLEIFRMADALATHAGSRMGVIAGNVAHADTPGYKAQDLPEFAESYGATASLRSTRPGHMASSSGPALPGPREAGGADAPNGNSVSLEAEMVKAVDVKQQHEMALSIYQSASRLLRSSLGRNG